MNHQEMYLLLSPFIDNELTETERSVVVEHLKQCEDCRLRVGQLRTLKRNVHSAGNVELPLAFASMVTNSIHHDEEVAVSWIGIEHFAERFAIGLALLVLLFLGIANFRQNQEPLPVERYAGGLSSDSAAAHILTKQGAITRDDVMFAVLTK